MKTNYYEVYFPAVPHWERSELIGHWMREHDFKSVQWDAKNLRLLVVPR